MYKEKKAASDSDIENRKLPVEAKDQLYRLGYVYYLEPHRIASFFDISGRGPLARLFQIYKEDFPKVENQYGNTTSKEAFHKNAEEIKKILKTKKLDEIEKKLLENLVQYLGLSAPPADLTIHLGLPTPEQFMENLIELLIKENQFLESMNVLKLGGGYLSLFRIAALQTLAEMHEQPNSIFLIEEPEAYLHPHLRRFFYKVLKKLADKGNQIIYTTHSTEFVDLQDYLSIIKVFKENHINTKTKQISKTTVLNFDKIERKVKGKGNEELYFSNYVILTEGQKDALTLDALLEKKGFEKDSKSISVIDCGSKYNLSDYIDLCNELGIDCFVMFDNDKGDLKSMQETTLILSKIKHNKDRYHMFEKSLEAELGLSKDCKPEDVLNILTSYDYNSLKKKYPNITAAVEKCLQKFITTK